MKVVQNKNYGSQNWKTITVLFDLFQRNITL